MYKKILQFCRIKPLKIINYIAGEVNDNRMLKNILKKLKIILNINALLL